jgi:hypothetical protein
MPTCNPYMISAMEMLRLLLWNNSNITNIAELHSAKYLKPYTEFWDRLVHFDTIIKEHTSEAS